MRASVSNCGTIWLHLRLDCPPCDSCHCRNVKRPEKQTLQRKRPSYQLADWIRFLDRGSFMREFLGAYRWTSLVRLDHPVVDGGVLLVCECERAKQAL